MAVELFEKLIFWFLPCNFKLNLIKKVHHLKHKIKSRICIYLVYNKYMICVIGE